MDNGGTNKSQYVLGKLAEMVACGRLKTATAFFLIAGHAKVNNSQNLSYSLNQTKNLQRLEEIITEER